MNKDQLQSGVLCKLKIGRWGASVKMPKNMLSKNMPKEIVRAMHDVIEDKTLLKDLATIRRTTNGWLQRNSLMFPIEGVYWIPKNNIEEAEEKLKEFRKMYFERRDILKSNLGKEKTKFKKKYPKFFDNKYYPSKQQIDQKFYFRWNFFMIDVPSKGVKILSPSLYKKEIKKFREMIDQMEEMTINLIGNMLFKRISTLARQCESGKINAGTVNAIDRFIKRWDKLWSDHVDEKKLKMIMIRLKKHMRTTNADRLKNNENFREKMSENLEKIIDKLQIVPDINLKRRLDV